MGARPRVHLEHEETEYCEHIAVGTSVGPLCDASPWDGTDWTLTDDPCKVWCKACRFEMKLQEIECNHPSESTPKVTKDE
jgi:Zn finger protein HypA/HybF involved in hydrogenase expression